MTDGALRRALEAAAGHVPDGHFIVVLAGPIYLPETPSPHLCWIASSIGVEGTKQVVNDLQRSLDDGDHSGFRQVPPPPPEA